MQTQTFDTLSYVKRLQAGGFSRKQAEAQAEALVAVVNENVATKHDILFLQRDIEKVRFEIEKVHGEIETMRSDTAMQLKELESKITIRFGAMLLGGLSLLAAYLSILPSIIN